MALTVLIPGVTVSWWVIAGLLGLLCALAIQKDREARPILYGLCLALVIGSITLRAATWDPPDYCEYYFLGWYWCWFW